MPHARAVSPCSPLSYTVPLSRPVPRLVPSYRVGGAFLFRNFLSHRLSSRLVPRVVGRGVMSSRLVPRLVLLSDGRGVFRLPGPISSCPCGGGVFYLYASPSSSRPPSRLIRVAGRLVSCRLVSSHQMRASKQAAGVVLVASAASSHGQASRQRGVMSSPGHRWRGGGGGRRSARVCPHCSVVGPGSRHHTGKQASSGERDGLVAWGILPPAGRFSVLTHRGDDTGGVPRHPHGGLTPSVPHQTSIPHIEKKTRVSKQAET